jgi:hypothetical protein
MWLPVLASRAARSIHPASAASYLWEWPVMRPIPIPRSVRSRDLPVPRAGPDKETSYHSQCPLDNVPMWLLTPYKSYLNGATCVLGSSRSSLPVGCLRGTYRDMSSPLTGKMTGVSDLSQKTPFCVVNRLSWMRSTGGSRAMVSVFEARLGTLHRGQFLELEDMASATVVRSRSSLMRHHFETVRGRRRIRHNSVVNG